MFIVSDNALVGEVEYLPLGKEDEDSNMSTGGTEVELT
jgi:hypothetical protein